MADQTRGRGAARINFTKARTDRFECPDNRTQAFMWDTAAPGLGLRATKGSKTYIFQARLHGRSLRTKIGSHEAWTVDEARVQARRLRTLIDAGVHPGVEKAERRRAEDAARRERVRESSTVAEAWAAYIAARGADWSAPHVTDHHKAMQRPGLDRKRSRLKTKAGPLWPLRGHRLSTLSPELLLSWLDSEAKTRPTAAARAYRLLRAFLTWCTEHSDYRGLVDPRTLLTKSVRRSVPKARAKNDALQREQLRLWFLAVQGIRNEVVRAYLQALLLTGARRAEMANLRWADIDFKWQSLTIRDKVEGERVIPLTPHLSKVLDELPRRNEWTFSSKTAKGGRLVDANHAHARVLAAAGLPPITLHGLRRSFGTLAEWTEAPVGVVAQIMGHKPSAVAEKHYRRRPLDLLRLWHMRIEHWILAEAGVTSAHADDAEASAKVVHLHRGAELRLAEG